MKLAGIRILALASLPLPFLLAGCGNYDEDVATICNVESLAAANEPGLDGAQKITRITMFLEGHVRSTRGKRLAGELLDSPSAERALKLRAVASAEGVDPCPFADTAANPAR